jgi:hypothetical protein
MEPGTADLDQVWFDQSLDAHFRSLLTAADSLESDTFFYHRK